MPPRALYLVVLLLTSCEPAEQGRFEAPDGGGCSVGETYCSQSLACVDLESSAEHCGLCDRSCAEGWNCRAGRCSPPGAATVAIDGDVAQYLDVIVDTRGIAHTCFSVGNGLGDVDLLYGRLEPSDDGRWHTEAITRRDWAGAYCAIAVFEGTVRVAYYIDTNDELGWATRTRDGHWTTQSPSLGGRFNSVHVESSGVTHVSHYDYTIEDLLYHRFAADGETLERTETVDADGDVGSWSSLSLDPAGRPVIAYLDGTQGSVQLARRGEDGWEHTLVEARTADHIHLAADARGALYLAYRLTTGELRYGTGTFDALVMRTLESGVTAVGLTLGIDDDPVLCFGTTTGVHCSGELGPDGRAVEVSDVVTSAIAVSIGPSNKQHVVFRDDGRGALMHAVSPVTQ
ncbi:MAG: hypothetical protein AAGF12_08005 [Myxococcota bacterium]